MELEAFGKSAAHRLSHRVRRLAAAISALLATLPAPMLAEIAFEDASGAGPFRPGESWGAGSWGDMNGDRWPDLFVANHRLVSTLYRNNGDGSFSDVTNSVDISGSMRQLRGGYVTRDTHGSAWADFEDDGDQDLWVTAGRRSHDQFYVNEGSLFPDRIYDFGFPTKSISTDYAARMPVWLDFDDDGKLDLVWVTMGKVWLFERTGGQFADVTASSGLTWTKAHYGQLADLNGDGHLDLIGAYQNSFPRAVFDISRIPFREISSILPQVPYVLDSVPGDFDGDLTTDLFLVRSRWHRLVQAKAVDANTFETQVHGSVKTVTFTTQGSVTFDLRADAVRSSNNIFIGSTGWHPASFRFTLSPADPRIAGNKAHTKSTKGFFIGYDPATDLWTFETSGNISGYLLADSSAAISGLRITGVSPQDYPPVLLLHTAGGFADRTAAAGLDATVACISGAAADFDNDMDLDLYLVCRDGVENLPNILYENLGDGRFRAVSGAGGAAGVTGFTISDNAGTGDLVSVADYDVDGFPDLFVTNGNNLHLRDIGPRQLFHNRGNANHWIELDLEGGGLGAANPEGIGAIVYVTAGGKTQKREQNGGYHLWTQNHMRLHFGLAGNAAVEQLLIVWPDGSADTYTDVAADALYLARQGAAALVPR